MATGNGPWQKSIKTGNRAWVTAGLLPPSRRNKVTRQNVWTAKAFKKRNTPVVSSVTAAKRAAVAPIEAGIRWPGLIPGFNDIYPTCSALAVASHLQAALGIAMTDNDIWVLHTLAGGDVSTGTSIESVLEAAGTYWLKQDGQQARLRSFCQADENVLVSGLVVGLSLPHDGHAVLTQPGGMVSWGRLMPLAGEPEEAWALEWETAAAQWQVIGAGRREQEVTNHAA